MVKFYPSLPSHLRDWALNQPLFFTASAPLTGRHINISPKGLPSRTLAFFDANHLAYIDHSGSGAETMSHVYENGRLTLMFCSFDTAPQILRLFCTGRVIEFDHPDFPSCVDKMGKTVFEGARAVILLEVFKISTACGFGVPQFDKQHDPHPHTPDATLLHDRPTLDYWTAKTVKKGKWTDYCGEYNARSLDGLGGMKYARRVKGEVLWYEDVRIALRRMAAQRDALIVGMLAGVVLMVVVRRFGLLLGGRGADVFAVSSGVAS